MSYEKYDNVLCLNENDNMLYAKLLNHFFNSDRNVYIISNDIIMGKITFENFITNTQEPHKAILPPNILENINLLKTSDNSDFIVVKDNVIICEYIKKIENKNDITIERWKALYSHNDKINDYLLSLNVKRIIIYGKEKEIVFNNIKMYGNDFEVELGNEDINGFISLLSKDNILIIDTDSSITKLKSKIEDAYDLVNIKPSSKKVLSLFELSRKAELYYFINNFIKKNQLEFFIFDFPDISQLDFLTHEEKLRITFDHHYRYYYDRYKSDEKINQLLKNVLGSLYSEEFILSRNYLPNVILKNGCYFLENSDNKYCSSINGIRTTTDQNNDYSFNINIFGPCTIFGALVDDKHTISSYMQRIINNKNYDYQVNNYGARAIDFVENIRTADNIVLHNGDKFVFVVSPNEKQELIDIGYNNEIISLLSVFNNPALKDYFIDEPVHCNHQANKRIADYILLKIQTHLLEYNINNKKTAEIISIPKNKNIFSNNKYLNEYLKLLEKFGNKRGKNGCILMNCNPFTNGHYKLIEYASKQVDNLFVFVVQEDKSLFKFEDRINMVQNGCQDLKNVIVVPSGKIFASSMLFPEYFNKEDNNEVSIDVSLDRELFTQYIAPTLNISVRFVGEENVDKVTQAFNKDIKKNLPLYGIEVMEIPRYRDKEENEISAKTVRTAIQNDDFELIKFLVPQSTMEILTNYCKEDSKIRRMIKV